MFLFNANLYLQVETLQIVIVELRERFIAMFAIRVRNVQTVLILSKFKWGLWSRICKLVSM